MAMRRQISSTERPVISFTLSSSVIRCSTSFLTSSTSIFEWFSVRFATSWNRRSFSDAIVTWVSKKFSKYFATFSFFTSWLICLFQSMTYFLGNLKDVGLNIRRRNGSFTSAMTSRGNGLKAASSWIRNWENYQSLDNFQLTWSNGSFSKFPKTSRNLSKFSLSGNKKICRWENRDLTRFSSSSTTSSRLVIPRTQIGVWADCATSKRL